MEPNGSRRTKMANVKKLEQDKELAAKLESSHDRFDRENTRRVSLKFNKNTDMEILNWLDKQDSKQGAIKNAILYKIKSEKENK